MKNTTILIIIALFIVVVGMRGYSGAMVNESSTKYLIVTANSVKPLLADLIAYRSADYEVKVITVDGKSSAEVKEMIKAEQTNLRYVLIAGDYDAVPEPNDNYYIDFDDDGKPDYPIGRLPFSDGVRWSNVIMKIKAFETQHMFGYKRAFFIGASEAIPPTGWKTSTYFENNLVPKLSGWTFTRDYVYCENSLSAYPDAKQTTITKFNQGHSLVMYKGHGSPSTLATGCNSANEIHTSDVSSFTNTIYPIFISFSCTSIDLGNNAGAMPSVWLGDNNGPVGWIGSIVTVSTFPDPIFNYITNEDTIGDAFFKGKRDSESYVWSEFHLYSDPALKLLGTPTTPPPPTTTCTTQRTTLNSDIQKYLSGTITRAQLGSSIMNWVNC